MQKMLAQSAVLHETNIRTSNFTTLNYQYTGIYIRTKSMAGFMFRVTKVDLINASK